LQLLLQDSQATATNANMVAVLGHFCRFADAKAFDTCVEEFGDGLGILRRLYRVCIGFSGGNPIEILYKAYTRSKQTVLLSCTERALQYLGLILARPYSSVLGFLPLFFCRPIALQL
jgi:hypothetical protein